MDAYQILRTPGAFTVFLRTLFLPVFGFIVTLIMAGAVSGGGPGTSFGPTFMILVVSLFGNKNILN